MNSTTNTSLDTDTDFEDQRRPLVRAVKFGALALAAFTVISLVVWGLVGGAPGLWGVVIGAAIGGGFVLLTALSVLLTAGTSPSTTMAVVLGGWLLKIVLLVIVLLFIRDLDFFHRGALLTTVVLALVAVLGAEVWATVSTRTTYVSSQ
ncbi:hypothetical protein [Corynebacterium massiliense]|uniref:ATP synthase protein I n=1 Tax=Corynebacterium massiliense DSM 45435 TaxID=1121364 RepID=A0ABY7U6X7_9CORY|nr:hypothetical protein [Corynebacterium massiliense]WCZ32334.1 hypothetical protein CMASS_04420 [Corynebacterium massiliense DSM 45435]